MLQVPGGSESQQVMLQVRFAEVNRKALTELGVNALHGPNRDQFARRIHDAAVRRAELHDDGHPDRPGGSCRSAIS